MKIRATYTGKSGLTGHVNGMSYCLSIQQPKDYSETDQTTFFCEDELGNHLLPVSYSTVIAFLRNWNNIQVVES